MHNYEKINKAIRRIDRRNSELDVINNTRAHIHKLCRVCKLINKYLDGQITSLEDIERELIQLANEVMRDETK